MKPFLLLTAFFLFTIPAIGQETDPSYDSTLAKELDADEYGMKWYILVVLKSGPKKIQEKSRRDSLFAGHLENIKRLADEGELVVAGPLAKNDNSYRGIFILDVSETQEAEELLQTDPAIKADLLDTDLYKWYGSAALPEYQETHKRIQKTQMR